MAENLGRVRLPRALDAAALEKNMNFAGWQPVSSFMPCTAGTNLFVDTASNASAIYRLRVVR